VQQAHPPRDIGGERPYLDTTVLFSAFGFGRLLLARDCSTHLMCSFDAVIAHEQALPLPRRSGFSGSAGCACTAWLPSTESLWQEL